MKKFTKLYYLPIILAKTDTKTDEQYSKTKSEILKTIKLLVILLILTSSITYSQSLENKIDKYFFENNKELGGECILKNSRVSIDGNIISKTFEFEVPVSGNYYMSAWIMGAETKNGLQEYNVTLDNLDTIAGKIIMTKTGWQTANLSNKANKLKSQSLYLTEGKHSISIQYEQPDVPEVEFVKFSRNEELSVISDLRYRSYLDSIKQICLNRNQSLWEKKDTLSPDSKTELPNPYGDYDHQVNISFGYTTYKRIYLYSGTFVIISTYASDYYDHVLEVFNDFYTENYSWVSKSYNGVARVRAYIGYSGYYYIRIRAYNQGTYGLADLDILVNGAPYLHYDDCPVTGNGFRCHHTSTSEYNYFTCKLTGDSRIWIEQGYVMPGKIISYNDDYGYHGGEFPWGNASRVKKSFSTPVGATLISSNSSWDPTGYCDVFMKCGNSTISGFPNLKTDDAIRSDIASTLYNCISWSGSRVDLGRYFWPPNPANPWEAYNHGYYTDHDLRSFDNFYKNRDDDGNILVRDVGQIMNFTRSSATSSNASVALWGKNIYPEDYTHASVTKPGNNQPHGYDWESKPGESMRTFHPRDALSGTLYGSILYYYRWDGTYSQGTPPMKSAILVETASITPEKQNIINNLVSNIPENDLLKFDKLYESWKNTWKKPELIIHTNPRKFAISNEYSALLNFCMNKGNESWPMVFEKYLVGDELNMLLIADLTIEEYSELMNEIKLQGRLNSIKNNVIPSQHANYVNYISAILGNLDQNVNKNDECSIYPIPAKDFVIIDIKIPKSCNVSVSIVDISGKVINEKNFGILSSGSQIINFDISNLGKGFYFCKLKAGEKLYINKIHVQR